MSELIDELLAEAGERMNAAVAAAQNTFGSVRTGRASPTILDRIMEDYRATASRLELPTVHFTTLGDDAGIRCANGYNLTSRGAQIVGEELARWIVAELAKPKAEPAAEPAAVARRAA